jgi:2-alkenal reductase
MKPSRQKLSLIVSTPVLLLTALACVCGGSGLGPIPTIAPPPTISTSASPNLPQPTLVAPASAIPVPPILLDPVAEQQLYIDLYRRVNPAVVSILAFQGDGFSQGTGFVIDGAGHVVTNNHVVEGASDLEVDFANGVKVRGELLGVDPTADLAVIKVEAQPDQLTVVSLGDSDQVLVGERVVAIGNPFGLDGTMTIGIVSGLGRVLASDVITTDGRSFSAPDIIQTDAAINPGNSGGPLLNLNGEVIGVNKAIQSESGVNSGVGFAIASNTVKRIVPALIKDGKFVYPYLGVSSRDDLTLSEVEALGLTRTTGAYVSEVVAGGPADQAGVRAGTRSVGSGNLQAGGDLIIAIDGREVKSFSDLLSYLVNNASVGQTVTLTVLRDGAEQQIPVTLGARP